MRNSYIDINQAYLRIEDNCQWLIFSFIHNHIYTPLFLSFSRPSEISHDHNYLSNGNQTLIKSEIDEEHDSGTMRTRNEMKERRRSDPRQCILCTVKGDQIPTVCKWKKWKIEIHRVSELWHNLCTRTLIKIPLTNGVEIAMQDIIQ